MSVHIIAVVDRSGSMERIRGAAIEGYNSFVRQQAEAPGDTFITTLMFNGDSIPTRFANAEPARFARTLDRFSYAPNGGTALRDALGYAIENVGYPREQAGDQVIVAVLTDGEENASKVYSEARIHTLVSAAQERGWTFIYLAANIDAFATGQQYGFNPTHTYSFAHDAAGTAEAFANMSRSAVAARMCP